MKVPRCGRASKCYAEVGRASAARLGEQVLRLGRASKCYAEEGRASAMLRWARKCCAVISHGIFGVSKYAGSTSPAKRNITTILIHY